jgi:uncharacterized protein (TIGR02646 family)
VRYISKKQEPAALVAFKAKGNEDWQATYDNLRGSDKQAVHVSLVAEQGFVCCYCGARIGIEDSHIEHFRPQSLYPDLQLDYYNLLASCLRQPAAGDPRHCGVSKDDWYDEKLMVSPMIADCGEFFRYKENGEIFASRDPMRVPAVTETIDKLNLNAYNLAESRKRAISAILAEPLSLAEIAKLIEKYGQMDDQGTYRPFCQAVLYCLQAEQQRIASQV